MTDPLKSAIGRLGVETSWARTADRSARTARARAEFEKRFLDEVDPEGVLPEGERNRRAAHARKAYYARLTLASVKARRARKAGTA